MMQYNNKCPIWGTEANQRIINYDINELESPRTGGKYKLDLPAFHRLKGTPSESAPPSTPLKENEKVKLTDWLIAERKKGVESPLVTDDVIEYIKTQPEKPMSERIKDFMIYLLGEYSLGQKISIPLDFDQVDETQHSEMLAHSSSLTFDNLNAIASYCTNKGYLEKITNEAKCFITTADGMIFVEDATKEDK